MSSSIQAMQGDTLDAIAHRYYGSQSVAMLPALINANPQLVQVFIPQHSPVSLPALTQLQQTPTLKLWD